MNFKEFVAIKQAQAIVEHIATLSESQAVELLGRLDSATVELVQAIVEEEIPPVTESSGFMSRYLSGRTTDNPTIRSREGLGSRVSQLKGEEGEEAEHQSNISKLQDLRNKFKKGELTKKEYKSQLRDLHSALGTFSENR